MSLIVYAIVFLPIIGFILHHNFLAPAAIRHFPNVPLLRTTLGMLKKLPFDDLLEYTTQISLVHKYKVIRAYFQGQWTLMVGCPLLALTIYNDTDSFPKLVPEEHQPGTIFAKLTGHSAFFSNAIAWRKHRKSLLDPTAFTTYVSKKSSLSTESLAELMSNMNSTITSHNAKKLDALKLMQTVTFDTLTTQFLNRNFNLTQSTTNNLAKSMLAIFDNAFTYGFTLMTTLFPSLQSKHNPFYKHIYNNLQQWETHLQQIITSTRKTIEIEGAPAHQDLVTKMVIASKHTSIQEADEAILSNLKMLFLPSQSLPPVLGATLHFLAQNSAIQAKAYDETKAVVGDVTKGFALSQSQMKDMPYLEAVIKETLRLYPTLCPPPKRVAARDVMLGTHFIPKGTHLMIDTFSIQRDASLWPNPEKFDPARFLDSKGGIQSGYLPFAAGIRRCPGQQLVLDLMTNILANILIHHKIHYPSPSNQTKLKLKAQVILIPDNLELEFHPRTN